MGEEQAADRCDGELIGVLVLGATGATGRLVVRQLLESGNRVTAIVRSGSKIPEELHSNPLLTVLEREISQVQVGELIPLMEKCDSAVCCLGHTMSWKGVFGPPGRLVADAVKLLCQAALQIDRPGPFRLVMMSSTGHRNADFHEKIPLPDLCIRFILKLLLPPFADTIAASEILRTEIGPSDAQLEWVALRPDSLIDRPEVTSYEVCISPTRSAIFNPGQSSRINVAHFIARLINDEDLWNIWRGRMPVLYNRE